MRANLAVIEGGQSRSRSPGREKSVMDSAPRIEGDGEQKVARRRELAIFLARHFDMSSEDMQERVGLPPIVIDKFLAEAGFDVINPAVEPLRYRSEVQNPRKVVDGYEVTPQGEAVQTEPAPDPDHPASKTLDRFKNPEPVQAGPAAKSEPEQLSLF